MSQQKAPDLVSTHIRSPNLLPKTITSEALLGDMKQIRILHEGHSYQLRITKLGKLILTK